MRPRDAGFSTFAGHPLAPFALGGSDATRWIRGRRRPGFRRRTPRSPYPPRGKFAALVSDRVGDRAPWGRRATTRTSALRRPALAGSGGAMFATTRRPKRNQTCSCDILNMYGSHSRSHSPSRAPWRRLQKDPHAQNQQGSSVRWPSGGGCGLGPQLRPSRRGGADDRGASARELEPFRGPERAHDRCCVSLCSGRRLRAVRIHRLGRAGCERLREGGSLGVLG